MSSNGEKEQESKVVRVDSKDHLMTLDQSELVDIVSKLKRKNGQLSDQISQMKVLVAKMENSSDAESDISGKPPKKKSKKETIFQSKRKIAIRFSYDGSEFNGLQRSPVPNSKITVEDCLFNAMTVTKIVDNVATSDYIAGGRTDVGVHAINNVFSIIVNSKLSEEKINVKVES